MMLHVVTIGTEIVSQIFKIFLLDQIPKYFSEENLQILSNKQNRLLLSMSELHVTAKTTTI